MISRRKFIQFGAIAIAVPTKLLANITTKKFNFKSPVLNTGVRNGNKVVFDLTIKSGWKQFFNDIKTPTWGISQDFLGQTLQVNPDDEVHFAIKNTLKETTTIHWHGAKLPAKADGGPHQPIKPNTTWNTNFKIIQPPATLWYHAHQMHKTGEHVYKGLAGMMIIKDNHKDLPSDYGVDDLPIIIQDRDFDKRGFMRYISGMRDRMMGKTGSVILVNGVVKTKLKAKKSLLRLRLLNGSNAKIYNLSFKGGESFHIIGSDGGLLEKPILTNKLTLAPAERIEILVQVAGKNLQLIHTSSSGGTGMMGSMMSRSDNSNIMQIDGSKAKTSNKKIPKNLSIHTKFDKVDKTREFNLEMKMGPMAMLGNAFTINGKAMDINVLNEIVQAGSVEIWKIRNSSMMPHPFHIHNVQFKIIKRFGKIAGAELGFKDVVLIHPNEVVEVIMKFPDYSDKNSPYMYHCHILEHEDGGMMGQFVVI